MKKKYADIIDSLELESDNLYSTICKFEEYCEESGITPMSFKAQVQYLLQLSDERKIQRAVDETILRSWKSVTYSVDNIRNKLQSRKSNFSDTAKSTFTPKEVY